MAQLSPLRRRMIEDMTIRNMSPATQRFPVSAVSKFSRYFGKSPERLSLEDVRAFQVHLVSAGISWPGLNQIVCALRFFYGVTLGEAAVPERIPYAREPRKLPIVLSADEVVRFLEAVSSLESEEPGGVDHGLCGRTQGLGGCGAESGGHRQRARRDPGPSRQRRERSQRDAVCANCSAFCSLIGGSPGQRPISFPGGMKSTRLIRRCCTLRADRRSMPRV